MSGPSSTDAPRWHYQLQFAVEGRIRFLSHLETVDTLLSALRRAGVRVALSKGMKPKPLIKVAMPRPVGVEAWGDIVEVELPEERDPDEVAFALSATLPEGLRLQSVRRLDGRYTSAASRVSGATFRVVLDDIGQGDLEAAVQMFRDADTVLVERRTPRRVRTVDVRAAVGDIAVVEGSGTESALRFFTRLTDEGSARPSEVVRAIAQLAGRELHARRIIRESIVLAEPGLGQTAEPALVGAEVPDGPEKPWGAC